MQLIPLLSDCLIHENTEIEFMGIKLLANIMSLQSQDAQISLTQINQDYINCNIHNRLIKCLDILPSHQVVIKPVLTIFGILSAGEAEQTQAIIDAKLLPQLPNLLHNEDTYIRKQTLWIISNILAGTIDQIAAILVIHGLMAKIIWACGHDKLDVQLEASICLLNLTDNANYFQLQDLITNSHLIQTIFRNLQCNKDINFMKINLMILEKLLVFGTELADEFGNFGEEKVNIVQQEIENVQGIQILEQIHNNDNPEIVELIQNIFSYFQVE